MNNKQQIADAKTFAIIHDIIVHSQRVFNVEYANEGEKLEGLRELLKQVQLPRSAFNYLHYLTEEKNSSYRFLLLDNPYIALFKFLHGEGFRKYQTKTLGLLQGLYAYIDRQDQYFRYLTSDQNHPTDQNKASQHFLLSFYYKHNDIFYKETPGQYEDIMRVFYLSNKKENPRDLDFKQILRKEPGYEQKRTKFEEDHNLLYVPSGEIDVCLLCWFILMQELNTRRSLVQFCWTQSLESKEIWEKICGIKMGLRWDRFMNKFFPENTQIPISSELAKDSIQFWLQRFGIIKSSKSFSLSKRGLAMIYWLKTYLGILIQEKSKERALLERIQYDSSGGDYWLDPSYYRLKAVLEIEHQLNIEDYTKAVEGFVQQEIGEDESKHLEIFISLLRIICIWQEQPKTYSQRLSYFRDRCRFDIVGQFFSRILRRTEINATPQDPSGWVAIPVLNDTSNQENQPHKTPKAVGFFIGQIAEKVSTSKHFLDEDNIKNLCADFHIRIHRLKTIVNTLAQVENKEIYYKSIVEEASTYRKHHDVEKTIAHTNKYIFGKLSHGLTSLRDEIPEISKSPEANRILIQSSMQAKLLKMTNEVRGYINRGEYDRNKAKMMDLPLESFFNYLFIIHLFSTRESSRLVDFSKPDELKIIESILDIRSFKELINKTKDIDKIIKKILRANKTVVEIPSDIRMKVPQDNTKGFGLFFINFLEIVRNFYKHWVKQISAKDQFYFIIDYQKINNAFYIHQFKSGPIFPKEFNYLHSIQSQLPKMRNKHGKYKWQLAFNSSFNTGLRGVKDFSQQYLSSSFQLYQSKEYKYELPSKKILTERIIYLKISLNKNLNTEFDIHAKI